MQNEKTFLPEFLAKGAAHGIVKAIVFSVSFTWI